jgi:Ca2+/H+ antiporter
VFNGYELAALALAALLAAALTARGRSTWRSGVALIAPYAALALVSALA